MCHKRIILINLLNSVLFHYLKLATVRNDIFRLLICDILAFYCHLIFVSFVADVALTCAAITWIEALLWLSLAIEGLLIVNSLNQKFLLFFAVQRVDLLLFLHLLSLRVRVEWNCFRSIADSDCWVNLAIKVAPISVHELVEGLVSICCRLLLGLQCFLCFELLVNDIKRSIEVQFHLLTLCIFLISGVIT